MKLKKVVKKTLKNKFKEHAKHHSKTHIAKMKVEMKKGKTFNQARKAVMAMEKKVKRKTNKY